MTKSNRQKIYDWFKKHENDHGAIYKDDWIVVTYADYDRIRTRITNSYPFAEWKMQRISDTKVKMLISIKEKSQEVQVTDTQEKIA